MRTECGVLSSQIICVLHMETYLNASRIFFVVRIVSVPYSNDCSNVSEFVIIILVIIANVLHLCLRSK